MNLIASNELTMSSREIAELTGKQVGHIHRDFKAMCGDLGFSLQTMPDTCQLLPDPNLDLGFSYEFDSQKRLCSINLNRELTLTLVSGYNVKLRNAIIKRWQELENQVQKAALPTPKELALMVIEAEEAKELALKEVDRLQGVCNTITAQFATGVTAPKFCKQLLGVNTQQVNNTLCNMGMLMRNKHGISPTSYSRDRYFAEKQEEYDGKMRSHAILTMQGAKWLYRAYLSKKLPMKNNWDGGFVHMIFEDNK